MCLNAPLFRRHPYSKITGNLITSRPSYTQIIEFAIPMLAGQFE